MLVQGRVLGKFSGTFAVENKGKCSSHVKCLASYGKGKNDILYGIYLHKIIYIK